jgi:hypothetical protein
MDLPLIHASTHAKKLDQWSQNEADKKAGLASTASPASPASGQI